MDSIVTADIDCLGLGLLPSARLAPVEGALLEGRHAIAAGSAHAAPHEPGEEVGVPLLALSGAVLAHGSVPVPGDLVDHSLVFAAVADEVAAVHLDDDWGDLGVRDGLAVLV